MKRFSLALAVLLLIMSVTGAYAADVKGKASFGGSVGLMKFMSGDSWKDGSSRPIFHAMFKYNLGQHWALTVEGGWGWNSYTPGEDDTDTLGTVVPLTFGADYRFHKEGSPLWPHVGAGVGIYNMGVKDNYNSWANDRKSNNRLTWGAFGFYGKLGCEYLWPSGASVNLDLMYHAVFSENTDKYSSAWGTTNTSFGELRIGANYYFTLKDYGPWEGAEPEAEGEN